MQQIGREEPVILAYFDQLIARYDVLVSRRKAVSVLRPSKKLGLIKIIIDEEISLNWQQLLFI